MKRFLKWIDELLQCYPQLIGAFLVWGILIGWTPYILHTLLFWLAVGVIDISIKVRKDVVDHEHT